MASRGLPRVMTGGDGWMARESQACLDGDKRQFKIRKKKIMFRLVDDLNLFNICI